MSMNTDSIIPVLIHPSVSLISQWYLYIKHSKRVVLHGLNIAQMDEIITHYAILIPMSAPSTLYLNTEQFFLQYGGAGGDWPLV